MNRKLAILAVFCILLGSGLALSNDLPWQEPQTQVSGTRASIPGLPITENVTFDTTWDLTYPYIYVREDIWVEKNVTLTILPKVVVRFDPGAGLHVQGRLIADGSPYNMISFIPFSDTPATLDWYGIMLENSTQYSIFDHVSVKFSEVGIASWNTAASITNSSIEYTFYYGILCGEDSNMTVTNNYVNFTTWAGIICDNRSNANVQSNRIKTSYYGIVCYDVSTVKLNKIETCWLGILAWGDANITYNEVRDCMDGIHGFYANPRIENNLVVSCDGNGTRFFHSLATVKNNTLVNNHVGMDIDYASRKILDNMDNNMVNGIEIEDCFYVGKKNLVIDNLFIDSGWSKGYFGSLTAQGSVTLYDCNNVTIRQSTIINTMNSIFATNSSFVIYNSTFDNALKAQIYLDANATGASFNQSVNPES
ncbi:MAG: right-handed parallel beta-helix repeat-containing protein, partial [Thermoplasmata archaeon]|nr:right-handed parallel beta-helix repeat-containing protein [Thermoplasmata archaeon]